MEPRINPGGETINHNLKNYIVNHLFYLETKIFCLFIYFSFLMKDFIIFILFDIVVLIFSDIAKWRWVSICFRNGNGPRRGRGLHSPSPIPEGSKIPVPAPDPRRGNPLTPRPRPRPLKGIGFPRPRKIPELFFEFCSTQQQINIYHYVLSSSTNQCVHSSTNQITHRFKLKKN